MLRNYLKLALRNLSRQKVFSFINIAGLAVGLASSLIILLWVQDELSFDGFHQKANRTYRLTAEAGDLQVAITPAPIGPVLEETFPEIEHVARLTMMRGVMMQAGENKFEEKKIFYTEPSFFEVFDFELLKGDAGSALEQPDGVIITQELAKKYFGTTDALGMTLRKNNEDDFTVTGILAPPKGNSHLEFDMLLPWAYLATRESKIKNNEWGNFEYYTYISFDKVKGKEFISNFEKKAVEIYNSHEARLQLSFTLQPLPDVHLHSHFMADVAGHGNFQYATVLAIIAVFIVVIACINFMNLSTARSARRAKEVGLRKMSGAIRSQLVGQFLGESLLITLISLIVALLIVQLALPQVNNLVGKQLSIDFNDPFMLTSVLGITILTGILSGTYPAVILSGFAPIKVLKKEMHGAGGLAFRNVLVTTQFVMSIVLLVGTAVVYQQLEYIRGKDLGFERENLLYISLRTDYHGKLNTWRTALQANPLTSNVTIASGLPTNHVSGTGSLSWQGKDPDKQFIFAHLYIDENFIPLYGMEIVSGRNFHPNLLGDSSSFLINEKAAEVMGFTPESAIGQTLTWSDDQDYSIIGVVKNFNFKPLQEAIEPMVMGVNTWGNIVVVKARPNKTAETIEAMEEVWNSLENVYPFSYKFVDEDLENLYKSERQVGTLFTVFAVLAILISCLGLYGLSAYIAEQRTREIGIRKALGASVLNILYLLNTRFVIPVFIAMIIAAPLAWFAMSKWLQSFAYRVNFNWGLVLIAGAIALLISLLTVSYESIKAAKVNPVKSLRTE